MAFQTPCSMHHVVCTEASMNWPQSYHIRTRWRLLIAILNHRYRAHDTKVLSDIFYELYSGMIEVNSWTLQCILHSLWNPYNFEFFIDNITSPSASFAIWGAPSDESWSKISENVLVFEVGALESWFVIVYIWDFLVKSHCNSIYSLKKSTY